MYCLRCEPHNGRAVLQSLLTLPCGELLGALEADPEDSLYRGRRDWLLRVRGQLGAQEKRLCLARFWLPYGLLSDFERRLHYDTNLSCFRVWFDFGEKF